MVIVGMYPCPFDVQDRHDLNATVLRGSDIYAYEEAKCTLVKNDGTGKFPERSLFMGLKELNVLPKDVDKWVFPSPKNAVSEDNWYLFFNWHMKAFDGQREAFGVWLEKHVEYVDHQICHASLAVFGSGFDKCAFLCMDGGGDFGDPRGYVFGEFKENKFDVLFASKGVDNIANFHSFATDAIGFGGEENGKTSGLAAYGKILTKLKNDLLPLISIAPEIGVKFDRERFGPSDVNLPRVSVDAFDRSKILNTYPSDNNVTRLSLEYLQVDVAATVEKIVRESVKNLLNMLRERTSTDKIVFSGGLFQNVALNGSLIKSKFKDFFFPSAPSDAGLSLGAALWVRNKNQNKRYREPMSAFLGPSFSRTEVEKVLRSFNLSYTDKLENLEETVAELISTGQTVGWFSGRAEYGPRSLGARSLLADPRSEGSKARINQLLKKRDWFMPYAPSILEEDLQDWVENPVFSPYMQIAFTIRKEKAGLIPAAVHIDGTSRVHVVRRTDNEQYWKLINAFKEITGIPIILNTSFNRHGIATISTPRHAVYHLLEGCMDVLAVEGFLARLDENRHIATPMIDVVCEDIQKKLMAIERLEVFKRLGDFDTFVRYLDRLMDFLNVECSNNTKVLINEGTYIDAIDSLVSEFSCTVNKSRKGRGT